MQSYNTVTLHLGLMKPFSNVPLKIKPRNIKFCSKIKIHGDLVVHVVRLLFFLKGLSIHQLKKKLQTSCGSDFKMAQISEQGCL